MRDKLDVRSPADEPPVRRLHALKDGQPVFAHIVSGELVAAATVAPPIPDLDLDPPDVSVPARLRMVAAAVPHHGYGATLVKAIRERLFADLVHDGCLSPAGQVLVTRIGLPMQAGKVLELLDEDRASQLAEELISFANDNADGVDIK